MSVHKFAASTEDKTRCAFDGCGKTRNAKAHKVTVDPEVTETARANDVEAAREEAIAADVAEARKDMLPEVSDATDDAEIAEELARIDAAQAEVEGDSEEDTLVAQGETPEDAKHEAAKKAAPKGDGTASIWVGWRITNAAVLVNKNSPKAAKSLAKKLNDAKPTGDLDRTVKLTADEFAVLDGIAAKFMEPGHTGPEIYSGRALRGRIAAAVAKIEGK